MNHKVHESLLGLLQPIDELQELPNNPNLGDVDAVEASYLKFGQVRPLVGVERDNVITIVAGNTQLKAAKRLGWTHVAVTVINWSDKEALEFALTDNRTAELGDTDGDLLFEMLQQVYSDEPDYWEALQWDEWEYAAMEEIALQELDEVDPNAGYTAPEIVNPTAPSAIKVQPEGDDISFDGDEGETEAVITHGSPAAGESGSNRVSYNHSLVFADAGEHAYWYDFLRWLKENYEGEQTSTQLIAFLRENTPVS